LLNFEDVLYKRVNPPYSPGEKIVKSMEAIDTDSILRPQAGAAERY
jgi:hypothetical protein